jgi:hypothetical protein
MAASKSRSRASSSSSKSRGSSRGRTSSASSRGRGGSSRGGGGASSGNSAKVTTDHEEIRKWAEARGGHPACVRGTERGDSCLLRIDFPGGAGSDKLEQIDWEEFFEQFDKNNLQFLYQPKTKGGRNSRFNKFVNPETVSGGGGKKSRSRGRDAR